MEQVNQAKAREIDGETLITILAIMNYKGPHSKKIRSEIAKMSYKNATLRDMKSRKSLPLFILNLRIFSFIHLLNQALQSGGP